MERQLSNASLYIDSDLGVEYVQTSFVNDVSIEKTVQDETGNRGNDDISHLFPNKKRLRTMKHRKASLLSDRPSEKMSQMMSHLNSPVRRAAWNQFEQAVFEKARVKEFKVNFPTLSKIGISDPYQLSKEVLLKKEMIAVQRCKSPEKAI